MLSAKRITLRPVIEDDWEMRYRWLSDPDINKCPPSGTGIPLTPATVRERTLIYAKSDPSRVDFTVLQEDGTAIGNAHLFNVNPWSRKAEFGVWLGEKSVWGQGYGTEVTRVLAEFAFMRLNLHKVYLSVDADNFGGIRCYEKAGFKKDGVLRDDVFKNGQYVDRIIMSLLKKEFAF
ncbi:acetyltransferase [Bacillus gobiensis]|uniref:Acetyltransferase n=2 Tax=Bacillus TaxID=1386 RepID=A0A0M4GDE3_9BACI|nr:acetyltransferase [Bacillus gobiensis]